MDRMIVYPGAVPLETDLLNTNRMVLTGLGMLAQEIFGTTTTFTGLGCVPTTPAGMTVNVNPGRVYALQYRDPNAYSSLGTDTVNQIVKQGVLLTTTNLSCPAPSTAGYSVNYLISAAFLEQDTGSVDLPYYNADNPAQAYSGPNGSGASQNTQRQDTISILVTPGIAASTGSQQTPATPTGYTPLYVVTVANSQTSITAANIAAASGQPILPSSLIASTQSGNLSFASATGTGAAHTLTLTPALQQRVEGMVIRYKAPAANTGPVTINDGVSTVSVLGGNHAALQGGEYFPNGDAFVTWNSSIGGGSYILLECTGGAIQVAAPTQSQHAARFSNIGNFQGVSSVSGDIALTSASFGQIYEAATGDPGGRTITFPAASGNGGKVIVLVNSSQGSWTLNAGNVNCAYGSGTSVTMPPNSTGVFMSDNTSFNAIGGSAAFGSGIRPQGTSGVGQWQAIPWTASSGSGNAYLPAGGTWAYWCSNAGNSYAGIAAGGTNVTGTVSLANAFGFCWRIA